MPSDTGDVPTVSASLDETQFEYISDFILGLAFVLVGVTAARR